MVRNNTKDCKLLRDPIYGYISIPTFVFESIIDKAPFQRLRCIRQTSYEPLYSAALHNRFTHSIGVYHLGCMAFDAFKRSAGAFNIFSEAEWDRLWCVFTYACLLHDVGHAPFSHTGEDAFKEDSPEKRLIAEIASPKFKEGIRQNTAAPHEFMSAFVALKTFPEIFELDDPDQASNEAPEEKEARIRAEKELFARCIIGHLYKPEMDEKSGEEKPLGDNLALKNCLISLLNSTIIDVDRLDYVIRDSYVSGFQNMSIDYHRLLSSICVAKRDGRYQLAYHKNALSIIENVIFAYDAERKWIQNHPVVLYEHFLVQHAIDVTKQYYNGLRQDQPHQPALFSYDSLTVAGNEFSKSLKISLLSDDDVIYSIKNIEECKTELTQEYFSRIDRRHAVWKSESEFRALFEQVLGPVPLNEMEKFFEQIDKKLRTTGRAGLPIINDDFLNECIREREKLDSNPLPEKDSVEVRALLDRAIPILTAMKEYMESKGFVFNFVYVSAKQFHSAFGKSGLNNILIYYPKFERAYYIKEVSTILDTNSSGREKFFYLFYLRRTSTGAKTNQKINAFSFSRLLGEHFVRIPG